MPTNMLLRLFGVRGWCTVPQRVRLVGMRRRGYICLSSEAQVRIESTRVAVGQDVRHHQFLRQVERVGHVPK